MTHKVGLGQADTLPRGPWLPGGRTEAPSVSWGCFPPAQVRRNPTTGYARRETGESPASDRRPSQKAKGGDRGPRVNSAGAEAERAGLSTTDEWPVGGGTLSHLTMGVSSRPGGRWSCWGRETPPAHAGGIQSCACVPLAGCLGLMQNLPSHRGELGGVTREPPPHGSRTRSRNSCAPRRSSSSATALALLGRSTARSDAQTSSLQGWSIGS